MRALLLAPCLPEAPYFRLSSVALRQTETHVTCHEADSLIAHPLPPPSLPFTYSTAATPRFTEMALPPHSSRLVKLALSDRKAQLQASAASQLYRAAISCRELLGEC